MPTVTTSDSNVCAVRERRVHIVADAVERPGRWQFVVEVLA
jgi:hypothetical protein